MSIDELDMGYWIKVTMQMMFWNEQDEDDQVPHIVEADHEDDVQGIAEEASSTDNVEANTNVEAPLSRCCP